MEQMNRGIECMVKCVCAGCKTTVYTSMTLVQKCGAQCGICHSNLFMTKEVEEAAMAAIEQFYTLLPRGGSGVSAISHSPMLVPDDIPVSDDILEQAEKIREVMNR